MYFKKSSNALFFDYSYVTFSRNPVEQVLLTNQKLEMNMPQIFKTKCIANFRKYRSKKNF